MDQLIKNLLDIGGIIGMVAGGIGAAYVTSKYTRRSQAESNKINEANGLVERYNAFTLSIQAERQHDRDRSRHLEKQVSLWRRWAQQLRGQVYRLGGEPVNAPDDLEQ